MGIEVERGSLECNACGAHVAELRRGRCWSCYLRWSELRPVGRGALCAVCYERRRDSLRLVELHGRSVPLCHGCAARVVRLEKIPTGIDELRDKMRRERRSRERRARARQAEDRGADSAQPRREDNETTGRRPGRDRRGAERRQGRDPDGAGDGALALPAQLPAEGEVCELDVADIDVLDETGVILESRPPPAPRA